MSVKSLRRWCSPGTVLVVMRPFDDPAQVLFSIRNAEESGAKVLLAQIRGEAQPGESPDEVPSATLPWIADEETAGTTSGHSAMWAEIVSRALILNSICVSEIPSLVQSYQVDRVIVSASRMPEQRRKPGLERVIPALVGVPVWVVGRSVMLNLGDRKPLRRILLPVTYGPDLEFVFRFAWQLAKAQLASLSVLHVFSSSRSSGAVEKTPLSVKSWLPWLDVKFSPADCRIELATRSGDPATQIIEFNARKPHDLIVLRSSASSGSNPIVQPKLVDQIWSQVPCPIAVLGGGIDASLYTVAARKQDPSKPVTVVPPDPTVAVGA